MNTKQIMIEAWNTARCAAVKFGGRASQYFAEALRMAWASIKNALATMVGSEKQIAWAKDIQGKFLAKYRHEIANLNEAIAQDGESCDGWDARIAKCQRIIDAAMAETSAKFWIDNRASCGVFFRKFVMAR